jgi:photosystem II stability/assembly factor-like uncharacterized protein
MAKAGLLFAGTDDGLVLLSNPNEIGRWLKIGQPFRGSAVRAVVPLPDQPLTVFAAVAGAGLQRSDDGGQSWQALLPDQAQLIIGGAPASGELHAAAGAALLTSRDAGATWQSATPDPSGTIGALASGSAPGQIYLGAGRRVLASADGGAGWQALGGDLPADVAGIAAPPQQPGRVYAVAGGLLYSSADGAAWQPEASAPAAAGPIAALPGKNIALLLALAEGGIARSADGITWEATDAGGAIGVLVPAGYHIDTAFAGGSEGVLLGSSDRGRTWAPLRPGLPPLVCIAGARLL